MLLDFHSVDVAGSNPILVSNEGQRNYQQRRQDNPNSDQPSPDIHSPFSHPIINVMVGAGFRVGGKLLSYYPDGTDGILFGMLRPECNCSSNPSESSPSGLDLPAAHRMEPAASTGQR
jgi:hypothetical protein